MREKKIFNRLLPARRPSVAIVQTVILAVALLSPFNANQTIAQESRAQTPAADGFSLLTTHCAKCHLDGSLKSELNGEPEGDFNIRSLTSKANKQNVELWEACLEYVKSEEMPPAEESKLSETDRQRLVEFLDQQIRDYNKLTPASLRIKPRRLNNRELANSVSDVLMIEDVGTHQPTANLLGDTLHEGFDTNGDALGISEYHLDQYIEAFRKIVDATIFSNERPATRRYEVKAGNLGMTSFAQSTKHESKIDKSQKYLDLLDLRRRAYFSNFQTTPTTGRYRIKIRAAGIDRGVYDPEATGLYDDDPIRLRVHLGDRVRTFDLPDNEVMEIELDEWIVSGTRLELSYATDGLRQMGNGNFKFQYRIAASHIKQHDPELYAKVVAGLGPKKPGRRIKIPDHWSNWTEYWQGARPRLFGAEIEGPIYESWPPKRQVALLGENPQAKNAAEILRPIAERAWRREVRDGELDSIVGLVQANAEKLGDIEALKEGIIAVFVSPSFLLINPDESSSAERFATKLSYFLKSTTPDQRIRTAANHGSLQTFDAVSAELQRQLDNSEADEFLREFPHAWLQLDRISFMAPDPDRYPLYDRKRISEDMIEEVLHFFRHAVDNNLPIPELLSADYSFLNADLAKVYDLKGVPQDSTFRKHTFTDGRRGGLLGMGAFLTLTADSLGTSPIHRAVYVMENFMGMHPDPPPPNVKISEPDVRQAKTIKEVLAAHMSDTTCASCHKTIDPYGYAFENFGPMGEWREMYTSKASKKSEKVGGSQTTSADTTQPATRAGVRNRSVNQSIPIDSSAKFRSGTKYNDIIDYRRLMSTDANRDRFVRCFITKLLTYANGTEPDNFTEIEKIVSKSAEHDYRIVDTLAAVIDSPLFREEKVK